MNNPQYQLKNAVSQKNYRAILNQFKCRTCIGTCDMCPDCLDTLIEKCKNISKRYQNHLDTATNKGE